MKKRSTGIVVTLAVVALLSLGLASGALAMSSQPVFSSVSPATASTTTPGSFLFTIHGNGFPDLMDVQDVTLQQASWPYDVIYASNINVHYMFGGDSITCYINVYNETPGAYDVVIEYYSLIGQLWPDTATMSSAFMVTGTPPATAPSIASIRPENATAGGSAFQLTVNGANFSTGASPAVVYWNGTALATTPGGLPNPTAVCYAAVPASLIAQPGTASITVVNPMPGGGTTSNAVAFSIKAAAATLTSISPQTTWAHYYQPPLVTLVGTNFQSGAQVLINGVARAATFVSSTTLTVQLAAADISAAGTLNFSVLNPSGTPTASKPLTLTADTTAPVTSITGADAAWHNQPVTLTVTATDAGGPGIQKTYYGIGIPPSIQLSGATVTVPAPAGGSGDGAQLVQAYSVDNCNNAEVPPAAATVNICTLGPDTDAFAPASVKKGNKLKIGYEADSITPTCVIKIKILKSDSSVAKNFNVGEKPSNTHGNYSFVCNLARGNYKVKVYATDAAGNAQSSMMGDSFTVK